MAIHRDRRDVNCLPVGCILGQVFAQAVAGAFGWRWVFGVSAPAFVIAGIAIATVLIEPTRSGPPASLAQKYRALITLAVRRELLLPNVARAGAFALNGLYVIAGASCGPLVAQLPIGFSGLMLGLAALLIVAAGLVAISSSRTAHATV